MKIKELRKLPFRKFNDTKKTYNSIIIINSGKKHDSGWALILIIGLDKKGNPVEIAAACDDICWKIPNPIDYQLRSDMYYPGGILHFWSDAYMFKVGHSLSSTDIFLIYKNG